MCSAESPNSLGTCHIPAIHHSTGDEVKQLGRDTAGVCASDEIHTVAPRCSGLEARVPCRYMVVLRLGGVYADVDTECKKPLDQLIQPRDTMIVSWENEFSTAEEAGLRQYVRKRQVSSKVPATSAVEVITTASHVDTASV